MGSMDAKGLLEAEAKGCFDFFFCEANTREDSHGFGLIRDRAPGQPGVASIASVGFGLTALAIGAYNGYITFKQGQYRALGTLHTLMEHAEQMQGFFFHFLEMQTGKRYGNCEVSIIDTAIAINGALTAGRYFGGAVQTLAQKLYERVQWPWFRDPSCNRFYMGYTPEGGFSGWWDCAAEQLMLYVLGAGSPTYPVPGDMMYAFNRHGSEGPPQDRFIHTWFGSLFAYQYSHAWIDFRGLLDGLGVDWWENSVQAARANLQFCRQMRGRYKTYEKAWGLTPCDGPWGYNGRYGAAPSANGNREHVADGTVPPAGALGSIVFLRQEALAALRYYALDHPSLWGRYGLKDALNVDVSPAWHASDVIGIDKGITLMMLENDRSGFVWDTCMQIHWIRKGLAKCRFSLKEEFQ